MDADPLARACERLRELEHAPPLQRHLVVAAVLTELLQPLGLLPVVVRGSAAEFYTAGVYATRDVDIVVSGLEKVADVLRRLGFEQIGTSFRHPEVPLVVDLPPEPLAGDPDRITEVEVDGAKAYVIGIEDLILDRLNAYVHWRDQDSLDAAVQLLVAQWERLDWAYLRREVAAMPGPVARALDEAEALARRALAEAARRAAGGDPEATPGADAG